jgi:hypothetical protein
MALPNNLTEWFGEFGQGAVVVYSRKAGWKDYETVEGTDEQTGWPFMGGKEGELEVQHSWWDPDTETVVVIVE